ncbi:capsular polysaccharide export system, inner membrane protein [Campylobacter volucris]|uniref:Capsular polysaccharide export system, inner membrane protein n=1 Tax=Campylobacter volucris TaxID=1031542 RepID=A0AAE5YHD7_9BACT|nr:capsular polysaccharide export system, inner membrane protein [Campylobacter volucris]AJC93633.1 capsular polysaccharide export system, inner membrane protein [Campylobacter volucris LMG 24379]KAB0577730.1 capsular polysaccharide export system, inner membrane protein [Campylobacter volucris]QBL13980.1 capsular polysaccharide export system, inner membrane protein [Campylobacter volucris]QEL07846.1 capsular polysaccharide export system, inner membrane protein [Campylobacter volucris]TXK70807.
MQNKILKKIRNSKILNSFKIVLILTAFVVFYYVFIAANRYVSESVLSIRSTTGNNIAITGLASLLTNNSFSSDDISYLKSYIYSLDMLNILEEKIKIRELYQKQKLDIFYSISDSANQEAFLKYYKNRVKIVQENSANGLLRVEVEGFSAKDAHLIATTIVKESERFINEISHKAAREQMAFAENELLQFKQRFQKAKDDLLVFQNKYGVFDPLKQSEGILKLVGELEAKVAAKEAELLMMQSYINDNAPQIITIKSEINALKKQLQREKAKITSSKSSQKLNDLAAKFQDLTIEVGFAESAYTTALKAYESARIEALRKIKQVVVIQSPSLPQSAKYPEILYNILTAFMILSLIYGIIKFIKMIIEEHRY